MHQTNSHTRNKEQKQNREGHTSHRSRSLSLPRQNLSHRVASRTYSTDQYHKARLDNFNKKKQKINKLVT